MSERDLNDESNEPDYETGVVEGTEARNRPAMGATFAESTQELDLDWKGSSAATDFLGIGDDVRGEGMPAPAAPGIGSPTLSADSWLHGIETNTEVPAPPDAEAQADETELETDEDAPVDGKQKKFGEPEKKSFLPKLVAAVFVLALAGGGAWYWKTQLQPGKQPVEVATKPDKPVTKKPAPPTKTTPVTKVPVADTPTKTGPLDTDPNAVVSNTPTDTQPVDPTPVVAVTPTVITPDVPVTEPVTISPTATNLEPTGPTTTLRVPPPSDTPIPGAVRRATEADYVNLWREQSVPLEAIPGDRRLRTINVGQVRVMLDSGEYFEGLLYAVGQNRVWLDLDLGRIAFEAASVRDITRIPMPASTTVNGKKGPDLSALPHVEVRLPGGWQAGRLIGREGNTITLVTDDGIRMVIESDEVRPITARKTRVLGTVEKLGGFTGKPAEEPKKP